MNLSVAGGAGFIGSNVIHQVIDEREVERLVNSGLPHLRQPPGE